MRTKLNVADKEYIRANQDVPVEQIAKDLDISENSINKFLEEEPKSKTSKSFARNERYGVVMNTEAASGLADDAKKNSPQKRDPEHIFRFKK